MKRYTSALALGFGLAVSGAACDSAAYACTSDVQCGVGRCESEGFCSFPDPTCVTGRRFGEHADEWSSRCLPDFGGGEGGLAEDDGGEPAPTDDPAEPAEPNDPEEPEEPEEPRLEGATVIWSRSLGSATVTTLAPDIGRGVALAGRDDTGDTGELPILDGAFVARVSETGVDAAIPLESQAVVLPSAVAVGVDGSIAVAGTYAGFGTLGGEPLPYTGSGGFVMTLSPDAATDLVLIGGSVELATLAEGPAGFHALGRALSGAASIPGGTSPPQETFYLFSHADSWVLAGIFEMLPNARPRAIAVDPVGAFVAAADYPATVADEQDCVVVGPGWEHVLDGAGEQTIQRLAAVPDGGTLVAGGFSEALAVEPPVEAVGLRDGFVSRIESDGAVTWTTRFGGSGSVFIAGLAVRADGAAAVLGTMDGGLDLDGTHVAVSGTAVFAAGLGPDGSVEWIEIIDSLAVDAAVGIAATDEHWTAAVRLGDEALVHDSVMGRPEQATTVVFGLVPEVA